MPWSQDPNMISKKSYRLIIHRYTIDTLHIDDLIAEISGDCLKHDSLRIKTENSNNGA